MNQELRNQVVRKIIHQLKFARYNCSAGHIVSGDARSARFYELCGMIDLALFLSAISVDEYILLSDLASSACLYGSRRAAGVSV